MHLSRHGLYKYHGEKMLFQEADRQSISFSPRSGGAQRIIVRVVARRSEASYEYKVEITPDEVLKYLLTLPPSTLAEALHRIADDFNLAKSIPELLQHLAAGAITAPRPTPDDEDDEDSDEEDAEEPDDEEDEDDA